MKFSTKFRLALFYFVTLICICNLFGCAGDFSKNGNDYLHSNYTGVIERVESNGGVERTGAAIHSMVCDSYLQLRQFSKFDSCINSLKKYYDYDADYFNNSLVNSMDSITKFFGSDEISKSQKDANFELSHALFYIMMAERSFVLGDTESAYKLSAQSFKIIERIPNASPYKLQQKIVIRSLGLAAYTCKLSTLCGGDDKYQVMLNGLYEAQLSSFSTEHRNLIVLWVMRNNLLRSRYQENIELYDKTKGLTGSEKFIKALYYNPVMLAITGVVSVSLGTNAYSFFSEELNHASDQEQVLYYLQKSYMGLHELDKAFAIQQQLLKTMEEGKLTNVSYSLLKDHASILISKGKVEEGITFLKKAVELVESQRKSISSENGRIGFLGDKQAIYADLIDALIRQGQIQEAFEYVERSKARALVDMLTQRIDVKTNKTSDDKFKSNVLLTFVSDGNTRGLKLIKSNTQSDSASDKSLITTGNGINFDELKKLFVQGESYIEYYGYDDKWYGFVLTSKGVHVFRLSGSIGPEIASFRKLLEKDNLAEIKSVSHKLYNALIKPVTPYLLTKNVTIVPHGTLHYLPFSALYDGKKYMVDKFNIRVLPSASVLQYLSKHKKSSHSLLALGNPDLGDKELALPYAETEVKTISKIVADSDVFVEKRATETQVKQVADQYKILHFASHGIFNSAIPLDSALLLAKDANNDGVLTVRELYDMDLHADLVTLSACETALGRIDNGDDVIGFTRGFLFAGASSIVSSLWKVDDKATYRLMTYFYKNLKKMSKREALAAAQRRLKRAYPNPYYWSAFQLSGRAI